MSRDPLIVITLEKTNDIQLFSEIIGKDKEATFFKFFPWTIFDGPKIFNEILLHYKYHKEIFPKHKIIFLLNTIEEYNLFRLKGIPCEYVNQNAFIDPTIFRPLFKEKKYDIVYNARFEYTKRHYLLKRCEKISLLSVLILRLNNKKKDYIKFLKNILPESQILNFNNSKKLKEFNINDSIPFLAPNQVNQAINKSKLGVILSSREGACYASAEYLLAGLPVVSTINIGGRNTFFDERFCRIVPSTQKAVKNAVDELISQNINPKFIREETIKKFIPHINRFKKLIIQVYHDMGYPVNNIDLLWEDKYIHKMLKYAQPFPKSFIKQITN